jgi:hypothetical protein
MNFSEEKALGVIKSHVHLSTSQVFRLLFDDTSIIVILTISTF